MYAGRAMRSRDRDDFEEDRPQRSSGYRRSRDEDFDEDLAAMSEGQDISSIQRMSKFGMVETPKLTKDNLGSAAVRKFIEHIHKPDPRQRFR